MAELIRLDLPQLTTQIKSAFQHWDKPYREVSPLIHSRLYRTANPGLVNNPRSALNQLLLDLLDGFQGDEIRFADTLRKRFADGRSVREVSNFFSVEIGTVQKWQVAGWEIAAKIFQKREQELRNQTHQRLTGQLESPTYTKLWGVDKHINALAKTIQDSNGPEIVAIEGIGGIGKTALVNELMRHLIESDGIGGELFEECLWVTARTNSLGFGGATKTYPNASVTSSGLIHSIAERLFAEEGVPLGLNEDQLLSMIIHRLAETPHLIVVDNLETVEDTDPLIETVKQMASPSKILLTTRHNLFHHPEIYHYALGEISRQDAIQLVRHEAEQRNLQILLKASDENLQPIYNIVGGNPLALRLVVGQTHIHSLRDVLNDLAEAKGKSAESLYTYIYWNAWNSLSEPAREAWLLMPLVNGSGMSIAELGNFSEMEKDKLNDAIHQLVTLNLIEHKNDLFESRYTIHSLTRSFLQGQVLKWGEVEPIPA